MELLTTQQVKSDCLKKLQFDLFVGASGFEHRATNSLRFLNMQEVGHAIAFGFDDRKNAQRERNDETFMENKVALIDAGGDNVRTVSTSIVKAIDSIPNEVVRIFVDYSSMTRTWYGAIISAIRAVTSKRKIECYFGYSPSVFEKPQLPAPNQTVGPIDGFGSLDTMDRPTALVVGLGYEKDRAIGLLQYVDPAACFALIADPPLDSRYSAIVLKNNAEFLNLVGPENQYRHPLDDLQRTGHLLLSLVWGLQDKYRIILAPLGVKPVSLMCLLLALRYSDLDVWRVTSGVKGGTPLRKPLGPCLVLRAEFGS